MRERSTWPRVVVLVAALLLLLLCGYSVIKAPALIKSAGEKVVGFLRPTAVVIVATATSEPQTQTSATEPTEAQPQLAQAAQQLQPTVATQGLCDKVTQYDRPPQPQVGHPSYYNETGVNNNSACWDVEVRQGFTLIVGGYVVDGQGGGVYTAVQGPKTVKVSITDGFIAIVTNEWARDEFCFRVSQAAEFGWTHEIVEPLPEWEACTQSATPVATVTPAPTTTATTAVSASAERRTSGVDQTIRFSAGESVFGWRIELDNGAVCDGGNCYLEQAPVGGSVTSGVVNPWPNEVPANTTPWDSNH